MKESIRDFLPCTGNDFTSYFTEKIEVIRRGYIQLPIVKYLPTSRAAMFTSPPGTLDWIQPLYYKQTKPFP